MTRARARVRSARVQFGQEIAQSLNPPPDRENGVDRLGLQPLSDLDLMIKNGWGDTPQTKLPADWRTKVKK
jgi:hypothetical protein